MNVEKILTEVYWDLSSLDGDQTKYPDHDTLRNIRKHLLNSRYGTIISKEVSNEESKKHTFIFSEPVYVKEGEVIKGVNMAGILNAQVQEWYKNNVDLLSVIDKLTARCEKLEEENTHLKDEVKAAVSREEIARWNLENRTHEVIELDRYLDEKNARIKELKQKLTAIFTSLGVDDTRPALDKIMEMKKLIKQNEEDSYLIDQQRKADTIAYENLWIDMNELQTSYEDLKKVHDNLVDRYEELQASYDNCVNECSDHVIEIDSLLQNLEVETVEQGIEKIKALKDGWMIKFDSSAEADLRVENERLKRKIKDLRKDVKFEFDHRMAVLSASVDQDAKIAELEDKLASYKAENEKLKSFIKDRTKEIHSMTEEIEKRLAKYREEKNNE